MELEQLKQQWDFLHQKLDEQQIINKRLMENAVREKINSINSYNIFGIAVGILVIPFLFIVHKQKLIDDFLFYSTLTFLIIIFPISIYWTFQFAKNVSLKGSIIEVEKFILRYKRYTYLSVWVSCVFAIVIFSRQLFKDYERLINANLFNLFYIILIGYLISLIFVIFLGFREFSRIKLLHQSISDLKEFEKE